MLNRTVALVGLMGAGKTAIGKRLAKRLGMRFVDSDHAIEEKAGKPVTAIFDEDGEESFRALELEVISDVVTGEPAILATGGGAYMQKPVREALKQHCITVWLNASLDVLVERVSRKNTRPLLEKGDKHAIMKQLMDERYPIYEQADIMVMSDTDPHHAVIEKLMAALEEHGVH